MKISVALRFIVIALLASFSLACIPQRAFSAETRQVDFTNFSLLLPPEWDGDEQTGFISDNQDEYALTLGRKSEDGDSFMAQITIYLLPNKPGSNAQNAAKVLSDSQVDPTEPKQNGVFWSFEGEPRTRTVKGRAQTYVNADPESLLIIISQDPQNAGAEAILASLKGITPKAKKLLGQDTSNGNVSTQKN